jgi:hypothetical protein
MPSAPIDQARKGPIDYLVMDYLAEVTMSIMQKQKLRRPETGYARDFVEVVLELGSDFKEKGFRIISNAGGVNPHGCKDAILKGLSDRGLHGIKIAVIDGDDILADLKNLQTGGHELRNMETGAPISTVADRLLSANVYFGARPIVEALDSGADVSITGRVTDTGLTLAPMIHEFGWDFSDFDKMSAGTIAGHIIECGAQCTGGNYTDWEEVPNLESIGFPIIEAYPDASFVVTKHENTGGIVNRKSVSEQLMYEIGDPSEYITPDCVADFTSISLEEEDENRVRVYGIKGKPDTPFYKDSASYNDGYKLSSTLVYSWPDPVTKAKKASEILKKRAEQLGLQLQEFNTELVGLNSISENPSVETNVEERTEVQMRISVTSSSADDLNRFGMEMAPLILTGPSGVTGFAGGRPKASEIVAYWPALLKKDACTPRVTIFEI